MISLKSKSKIGQRKVEIMRTKDRAKKLRKTNYHSFLIEKGKSKKKSSELYNKRTSVGNSTSKNRSIDSDTRLSKGISSKL